MFELKRWRVLFLFLLITITIFGANFPLEDVKPGLTGVGKTVFYGTEIEEFPVEIMELFPVKVWWKTIL